MAVYILKMSESYSNIYIQ